MAQAPNDSDLLVKFERDNIKDDYRLFCCVTERTFFDDFQTRLKLDARLLQMCRSFEEFKKRLRKTVIARYNLQLPPKKPTP